jgi:hypothetical protein
MATNTNAPFGLRPIGKVGQNDDNQGLASYGIAANSSAIYQFDPVQALGTGYIDVVSTTDVQILGSLNGVFFTNTSTKKPTWTNHLDASNTATDIIGYVASDPYERFEIEASSTLPIASIFANANIVYTAGSSANYLSKVQINTSQVGVTTTSQLRIIGVTNDSNENGLLNATTYSTNVNVVAIVNNHFYKQFTGL